VAVAVAVDVDRARARARVRAMMRSVVAVVRAVAMKLTRKVKSLSRAKTIILPSSLEPVCYYLPIICF
jgi:hypothetical protein